MGITLNLVIEALSDYDCENYMKEDHKYVFSQVKFFSESDGNYSSDVLYVAPLSTALSCTDEHPELRFLCLRDRFRRDDETDEALSGKIVVTENMDVNRLYTIIKDRFDEIAEWNTAMWMAAAKDEGLLSVLNLSRSVIKNSINVSDSSMRLIANTDTETDDQVSLRLRKYGYHPEETLVGFKKAGCYDEWNTKTDIYTSIIPELSQYLMVNRVFKFRDAYFMHIVMVCDHVPYSPGLLDLFKMLLDVLNTFIIRERNDIIKIGNSADQLISDLIENDPEKRDSVCARLNSAGIPYNGSFRLLIVASEHPSQPFLSSIRSDVSRLFPNALSVIYQQRAVILARSTTEEPMEPKSKEFFGQLNEILEKQSAQCGLSMHFTSLSDFSRSYADACLALNYSTVYRESATLPDIRDNVEYSRIWPYERFSMFYAVSKRLKGSMSWKDSPYWVVMCELYKNDLEHSTNNVQMLYLYLRHERHASVVAKLLFMHRNNIAYRINRICEAHNLDLEDPDVRLNLLLAILMLKTMNGDELT